MLGVPWASPRLSGENVGISRQRDGSTRVCPRSYVRESEDFTPTGLSLAVTV